MMRKLQTINKEDMKTKIKKNDTFLYIGAFFVTTGSLSIIALTLMLLYITVF